MSNFISDTPHHKESELWIDVPKHWAQVPLKYLCSASALYGANVQAESYSEDGVRFIRTSDIREDGSLSDEGVYLSAEIVQDYILQDGDLIISRSGTVGRSFIYSPRYGKCAYAGYLVRFVFSKHQYPKYYFYVTKSQQFQLWIKTTAIESTIGNVNGEKYANLVVPNPPLQEQCTIAYYLDHETAHTDILIDAKQRLLELLVEKRQALISHSITHGLNPDTPFLNTDIAWLGDIPKHWDLEYSRWLFDEIDERSETGDEELLSVSHLTGVTPRSEKEVNMFMAETNEGYKICQSGDLVINTLWAWMGAMGIAFQHGIVSPAYNVYRPTDRYNPRYLDFLVRLPNFAKEATRYSKGVWSSRLRLYPEEFFLIQMPIPPLDEQQEIVDYLDREISKIDKLSHATQSSIALLSERRVALISAAVTGQIEIPEASCN